MKLIARAVTALALLAFATPALPCGEKTKTTTASATKGSSTTVAKSGSTEKQKKAATESKGEAKPATAAN
jgi:hypothetical protein